MSEVASLILGKEKLTSIFGRWPSFHDESRTIMAIICAFIASISASGLCEYGPYGINLHSYEVGARVGIEAHSPTCGGDAADSSGSPPARRKPTASPGGSC
jgi:hypothetical protein